MLRFWIFGTILLFGISYFIHFTDKPEPKGQQRAPAGISLFNGSALSAKDIFAAASAPDLKVTKARVLIDNDAAFDSKLEAIKSARPGETIRLAYYIYSQDESSAVLYKELLNAAARGVHVRLLADFLTNYKQLDLFSYLETQSKGMIQVKLYGRPTPLIIRDVMYLTTPCPPSEGKLDRNTCSDAKWKALKNTQPDFYARLMLAGLYDLDLPVASTALLKGQILDTEALKSGGSISANEKKQFLDFLKLAFKAKVKHDPIANIKVLLALQLYGDKLNPILNEIIGRVPLAQNGDKSYRDWEHVTDFTHHKVLIIENRIVQLGGRNIENSYHMKPNALTKKYIFMDTDMIAELSAGGEAISKAYDRVWNFNTLTMPVKNVRNLMPNDFVINAEATKATFDKCSSRNYKTAEDRVRFEKCVEFELERQPSYKNLAARINQIGTFIDQAAKIYNTQYLPKKSYSQSWKTGTGYSDELSENDIKNLFLAYIENLPFDKRRKDDQLERTYGSVAGQELQYGKYIHQLWYKGLENACVSSAKEGKEKRVIIHSAYFLPPAILLRGFSKMLNGTWKCDKVRVTFLTNSPETTDLNYINVAARYVMATFFQTIQNRREIYGIGSENRAAKFEYFEYLKEDAGSGLSLHTKTSVLGDDMIIGSANADVRSYYMDTNNGFFIRGAKDLNASYISYIDSIITDRKKTRDLTAYFSNPELTTEAIYKEDLKTLEKLTTKAEFLNKLSPETKQKIYNVFHSLVAFISDTTLSILKGQNMKPGSPFGEDNVNLPKESPQQAAEQKYDRLLQLL